MHRQRSILQTSIRASGQFLSTSHTISSPIFGRPRNPLVSTTATGRGQSPLFTGRSLLYAYGVVVRKCDVKKASGNFTSQQIRLTAISKSLHNIPADRAGMRRTRYRLQLDIGSI